MKKRILAALLAIMMFASTTTFASPANFATEQEVEQFFSLLNNHMETFLREMTEDFGDRFWSFSLGRDLRWGTLEEAAEHYNNHGDMLGGFSVRMTALDYVQLRHQETVEAGTFAFGTNIARREIAEITNFVFNEFATYFSSLAYPGIRRGEFTVPRVLETYGLNTNQFIDIYWRAFFRSHPADRAYFMETYGDSWMYILIHNHVYEWVESIGFNARMEFPMREFIAKSRMIDALRLRDGMEFFHGFRSLGTYSYIWIIFTRDAMADVMTENPAFIEGLTRYTRKYGVDGFLEILDFDILHTLRIVLDGGEWHLGLLYLDSLFDGLISENLNEVIRWSNEPHNSHLSRADSWIDHGRTTRIADITLTPEDTGERFSFDITGNSSIEIAGDIASGKINIFFHNRQDQAVRFQYHLSFYTFDWDFSADNVWVQPGGSFFVQYNLDDLEFNLDFPEYRWQYTVEAHFSIINPYGPTADGEFAFRWIE